jgi:hypothetical protein
MLEFSILDFILTASLCYMCGVGTGLVVCCKWKEHIAIVGSSSQGDLTNFASPPPVAPQFSATATAMPSAPAMKITYE